MFRLCQVADKAWLQLMDGFIQRGGSRRYEEVEEEGSSRDINHTVPFALKMGPGPF